MTGNWYTLAADAVLMIHLCYILFTVAGFAAILIGGLLRWRWVRNIAFRILHLSAVVLVAVEAIAGVLCPLTRWEHALRRAGGSTDGEASSLVARIVRGIIFHDVPEWVFLAMYVAFAAAVGMTLLLIPPGRKSRSR